MVTGKWNLVIQSPAGPMNIVLDVKEEGDVLTGSQTDESGTVAITNGKVKGDEFSYKVKVATPFGKIEVKATCKVEGDTLTGNAKMILGNLPIKGERAV